jgi:Bardet-Biedl syndrome 7 protein
MNTLSLKGNFSQGEMHSWIGNCLPEVPERVNTVGDENVLIFKNVFVETFLVCKYSKGEAEFRSDNISTISIIKDFVTKEATTKHIKIELSMSNVQKTVVKTHKSIIIVLCTDINDSTIDYFAKLVHPKLKFYNDLNKNHMILQALLELNVQNDDEFELLSENYKNFLRNKQNLEEKFNSESSNLNRLIGILTDFYVDKNKFKGINVRNKLEMFVETLSTSYESDKQLLEAFCATHEK